MPKYIVQDSLRHDGQDCKLGDPVEMSEAAAQPLLASGVLIDLATAKAKAKAEADAKAAQEAADKAAAEAQAAAGQ